MISRLKKKEAHTQRHLTKKFLHLIISDNEYVTFTKRGSGKKITDKPILSLSFVITCSCSGADPSLFLPSGHWRLI